MRILKICCLAILLSITSPGFSFSEDTKVAAVNGSKFHACLIKNPSNILISLKKKKFGVVLDFEAEIARGKKSIKKTNAQIKALKGKTDSASISKRKKLKKTVKNLKLLLESINNCRNKNNSQISTLSNINCGEQGTLPGTDCDDFNPCTLNDKCQDGKCLGTSIKLGVTIACSFSSCQKSVEQCKDNKVTICAEGAASDEICNNIDDDCNGETDEREVCSGAPTITAVPTAGTAPTSAPLPTAAPIATNTATSSPTNTRTFTPTNTRTNTSTATPSRTPTRTSTPTNTPIKFCPVSTNGINLAASTCSCQSNLDCLSGICVAGATTCSGNGTGCPKNPNGLAVSPANCPCTSNLDCTGGICAGPVGDKRCSSTSLSIGCALTDNNIRANFPGCGCTDNSDCLSPMSCTTIAGTSTKFCSGGGVTCSAPNNTQGLNPRNCPCNSNSACQSNNCAAAQGSFASACR